MCVDIYLCMCYLAVLLSMTKLLSGTDPFSRTQMDPHKKINEDLGRFKKKKFKLYLLNVDIAQLLRVLT